MGQAEVGSKTGRRRGRDARMAARAAPLAEDLRPVRPGLHGGRYRPLLEQEVKRIHRAALDALQAIGLGQAIPSCVEVCTAAGAEIGEDGRLRFPQALVEDVIAKAWRRQPLYGQQEKHDMLPAGDRVYYGTAGAATQVIDLENNNYRDATIRDLYDSARIAETLDWAGALLGLGFADLSTADPAGLQTTLVCLLKTEADHKAMAPEAISRLAGRAA
ncbi:MAG: trimethylamine methyltransferase family protein [Rhodospirillales bacterium]|nr:trimethylamine methyltransferase family protein [Rhodospirillales bacterium]